MKKLNTRAILILFVMLSSVASYVFLAGYASPSSDSYSRSIEISEELEEKESSIALPDITLAKEIIEVVKHFSSLRR